MQFDFLGIAKERIVVLTWEEKYCHCNALEEKNSAIIEKLYIFIENYDSFVHFFAAARGNFGKYNKICIAWEKHKQTNILCNSIILCSR